MSPLFSIVIPVYNLEKYILKTLESVFQQTWDDYEVIVVNDHSTDGTREAVEESSYEVELLANPGKGVGSARNFGASRANGHYLCFLDGDDCWFPYTLEVFHRILSDHDRLPWIVGRSLLFRKDTDWAQSLAKAGCPCPSPEVHTVPNLLSLHRQYLEIHTGAHAIRRDSFLECGGYDESLTCLEDGELYLKLSQTGPLALVGNPILLAYRQREGSASAQHSVQRVEDCFTVYTRARKGVYAQGNKARRPQLVMASRYLRPVLVTLARQGRMVTFISYWKRCLLTELKLGHLKFVVVSFGLCLFSLLRRHGQREPLEESAA